MTPEYLTVNTAGLIMIQITLNSGTHRGDEEGTL